MIQRMKFITIFILLATLLFSCSWENIFSDETYQDSIRQNIGGQLIRNIHYSNDFQAFWYNIEYLYKKNDSDSANRIGSGFYYGKKPPENEQILQVDNWLVFKTSGDREKDLLFISRDNSNVWIEFEISPKTIESTDSWRELGINSSIEYWDSVSKINKIDENGYVTVWYTYAIKDRIFSFQTGKRKIVYKIDLQTGKPEIVEISKK